MERQKQLYLAHPETSLMVSTVLAVRPHSSGAAVAVAENIIRPGGGGEPRDRGVFGYPGALEHPIVGAEKFEGLTWLIASMGTAMKTGDPISVELDLAHRERRRRLHTSVHLAIRAASNLVEGVRVCTADIDEAADKATILLQSLRPIDPDDVIAIDCSMRSQVLSSRPVTISTAKSVDHAEGSYGKLFRLSDRHALSGRVRLVCIEDYDVNPCSGLHHPTTNIGPYTLDMRSGDDPTHFVFSIGLTAAWTYWMGKD